MQVARQEDPVGHTAAYAGMLIGAGVGAVVGAVVVGIAALATEGIALAAAGVIIGNAAVFGAPGVA